MSEQRVMNEMISDIGTEAKIDMRDKLVANLRNQARQSSAARQARTNGKEKLGSDSTERARISIVEGEPQSVLIKKRNEDLAKDIVKLRNRYAKLLVND